MRALRWFEPIPMVAVHVAAVVGLFAVDAPAHVWVVCFALWAIRMFAITAGYHRYFSHRTFETSRFMQAVFAVLAQTSAQKGVLWWAAHHRHHHKHSDGERDVHSVRQSGFWHSHILWIFAPANRETRISKVRDLARFPELRFLDKFHILPSAVLGFATYLAWGVPGFLIGFCLSTVITWHTTFLVNSLAHVMGRRRFETSDDSKNSAIIALLTFGEGWHNNHHHHMMSTRQGLAWYEFDPTYAILKVMSWMRLVWDLREPPAEVMAVARGRISARERAAEARKKATEKATEAWEEAKAAVSPKATNL